MFGPQRWEVLFNRWAALDCYTVSVCWLWDCHWIYKTLSVIGWCHCFRDWLDYIRDTYRSSAFWININKLWANVTGGISPVSERPLTAICTANCLTLGLCKETVEESTAACDISFQSTSSLGSQWHVVFWRLTHWSLGDLDAILKLQFSISFYWLVSSRRLRIMPWHESQGTSPIISQHWFR